MAGHSKWANIRRHKGLQDKKKAKLTTRVSREIMIAVQLHGKEAANNPRLRDAIALAKANNISKDTIQRAISKGTGIRAKGSKYEEVSYEGYGIRGTAILIECSTQNRNRTVADIRNIFSRYGASLGENGSVSWIFKKKGFIELKKINYNEEEFFYEALELGALNIQENQNTLELDCEVDKLSSLREDLEKNQYSIIHFDIIAVPSLMTELNKEDGIKMIKFLESLEEHEDVQRVYSNALYLEEQ